MHTYECNRCGREFGSPAAVRMHLRRSHFQRDVCDKCGCEVRRKNIAKHVTRCHPTADQLPDLYKPPPSKVCNFLAADVEEPSFWEVPGSRLDRFVAHETATKCRICGKTLGGVHGREEHERRHHHFTTAIKDSLALRLDNWNMLDHLRPDDVSDYLKELKPAGSDTMECNRDVNQLVEFFLRELPCRVEYVIRGGSYGKGTCVRGRSDLDLVVFVRSIPFLGQSRAARSRLSDFLHRVKHLLQNSLLATRALIGGVTSHALRFQYKCHDDRHIHHVDLLPCNDLLGPAPSRDDRYAVYELIANCKSDVELQLLSATLLQFQVDFVRRQPAPVRDLMRLVKHWKLTAFGSAPENRFRRLPNAYALELITIHTWQTAGKPIKFQLLNGLAAVLHQLVEYENLMVVWEENYSIKSRWVVKSLQAPRPIVLDPANPNNNVCESSNTWDEVAYVARSSLHKPFFTRVKKNRKVMSWE